MSRVIELETRATTGFIFDNNAQQPQVVTIPIKLKNTAVGCIVIMNNTNLSCADVLYRFICHSIGSESKHKV